MDDLERRTVRHPALYWVKYYLSRKSYSYEQIVNLMDINDLSGLTEVDLQIIEEGMCYPSVFVPTRKSHKASQRFLKTEGIYEAWHRTKSMQQAMEILKDKRLRDLVEILILSPIKAETAVGKIKSKLGIRLSVSAYELFQHYFWHRGLLSSEEWGQFVQERRTSNVKILQLAADTKDVYGAQVLLWRAGLNSSKQTAADPAKGFSSMREIALHMFHQGATAQPSKYNSEMLLNYTKIAATAHEILSGMDTSQDIVDAFTAFQLRTEPVEPKSLKELTGGNVSLPEEHFDE